MKPCYGCDIGLLLGCDGGVKIFFFLELTLNAGLSAVYIQPLITDIHDSCKRDIGSQQLKY